MTFKRGSKGKNIFLMILLVNSFFAFILNFPSMFDGLEIYGVERKEALDGIHISSAFDPIYAKTYNTSIWDGDDDVVITDVLTGLTDNNTITSAITLGSAQNNILRLEFPNIGSLSPGDTVKIYFNNANNMDLLDLVPYIGPFSVSTTNKLTYNVGGGGIATYTLTAAFIADLYDQGSGTWAARVVEDGILDGTVWLAEVDSDLTPPSPDTDSPTWANLTESADPLELGNNEIISIDVSDASGINRVYLEYGSVNHSMTYVSGVIWQNDTWVPNSVGNYSYIIWMEDNYNNWNSTSGSIKVVDTTSPLYSDLIESADPLKLGQNETILIKVFDSPGSGVNQTLLEYGSLNHTMIFIGEDTWSWNNWKPSSDGIYPYKIYMQDMQNNWNATPTCNITVITTTAPVIENLTESADPLELGYNITITVDVFDNNSVSIVLIELEDINYTMSNLGGGIHTNLTGLKTRLEM